MLIHATSFQLQEVTDVGIFVDVATAKTTTPGASGCLEGEAERVELVPHRADAKLPS